MRDEHQEAVGARIARLREQQGWSQRALARWVGLDQSAVSRIEAGRRRLSADELHRFAHAFQVSADDLLPSAVAPSAAAPLELDSEAGDAFLPTSEEPTPQPPRMPRSSHMRQPFRLAREPLSLEPEFEDAAAVSYSIGDEAVSRDVAGQATARRGLAVVPGLPLSVAAVAHDWFALRRLAEAAGPAQRWSTGHSAEGKSERVAHAAAPPRPSPSAGDVLYDRVARFWRSELHVEPDEGPLPDLVPLLEDGHGTQVIVARVAGPGTRPAGAGDASSERPVAAAFSVAGVPFVFVNAARPVVLQRFALAHAFAHHVLGHGDVVDHRIEWSRKVPPEAAANDFSEEFLAPVRAVQRWYERRDVSRWVRLEDLLDLANAFGISVWSALYRSRAAGRLPGKQFHVLRGELQLREWELLPRQAYLGGLRDTLSHLTPQEALPPGSYGGPAVLRVPAAMRGWALAVLQDGRMSLEEVAGLLHLEPGALGSQLASLGLE